MSEVATNRELARTAVEQICSRGDMTLAPNRYAEDFADYVGSLEYTVSTASSARPRCAGRCSTTWSSTSSTRSPRAIA